MAPDPIMRRANRIAALGLIGLVGTLPAAELELFVDSDACPGERCSNSLAYVAKANVSVFETPSIHANKIGEIRAGETLQSKSGEVHTVPTRFEVHRQHKDILPGDEVFALTYIGEGNFRIFHNGELTQSDLGFSPWGGSTGKTCDKQQACWGRLVEELEFTWWLRVMYETNLEGWVVADKSIQEIQEIPDN